MPDNTNTGQIPLTPADRLGNAAAYLDMGMERINALSPEIMKLDPDEWGDQTITVRLDELADAFWDLYNAEIFLWKATEMLDKPLPDEYAYDANRVPPWREPQESWRKIIAELPPPQNCGRLEEWP